MELRQQRILAAIVKEYSETANPVGSNELVEKYRFKESSATIRNEMAELEKQRYIFQPHKSAGRVPTDKGYRFFINELMHRFELSEKERRLLREQLLKLKLAHEQMGRQLSNVIAQVSGQAAFVLLPQETSVTGLSRIVGEPEISKPESVKAVANLFEHIDQHAAKLLKRASKNSQTFIGKESPLPVSKDLSVVVSRIKFPSGKRGILGIVGPKRMSYAKNLSILEYLAKLISGSAVILLVVRL